MGDSIVVQFSAQDVEIISGDPVTHALDDIRIACMDLAGQLKVKHNWSDTDFRIVAAHRIKNACQSALALYSFRGAIFPKDEYWTAFFAGIPSQSDLHNFTVEL